jgi:hypothetical protein
MQARYDRSARTSKSFLGFVVRISAARSPPSAPEFMRIGARLAEQKDFTLRLLAQLVAEERAAFEAKIAALAEELGQLRAHVTIAKAHKAEVIDLPAYADARLRVYLTRCSIPVARSDENPDNDPVACQIVPGISAPVSPRFALIPPVSQWRVHGVVFRGSPLGE